ncbi:MAG TPA: DUF1559 domain-containing protein [Armatimonadota bacterium]|jgi:prepilin-type N-terminal cleavage/methylation domain-containing protein/prepilin-type processing-associated H-X9-DG protein
MAQVKGWVKWRAGFSLVELLVVVAIVAILAAMLFPAFARARDRGNEAACLSNLRQLGVAAQAYADDHDGFMPPGHAVRTGDGPPAAPADWYSRLEPFVRSPELLLCPSDRRRAEYLPDRPYEGSYASEYDRPVRYTSYLLNGVFSDVVNGRRQSLPTLRHPTDTILFAERDQDRLSQLTWVNDDDYHPWEDRAYWGQGAGMASERHHGGADYLYADGHAAWRRFEQTFTPNGVNQHLP